MHGSCAGKKKALNPSEHAPALAASSLRHDNRLLEIYFRHLFIPMRRLNDRIAMLTLTVNRVRKAGHDNRTARFTLREMSAHRPQQENTNT